MTRTSTDRATVSRISQLIAAQVLGMRSPGSLRALSDAPRNSDRARTYDLRLLVPWYIERRLSELADPLMVPSSQESASLEAYRAAKARLAQLDLAERTGVLVNRAVMRSGLGPAFGRLRSLGERLQTRFGPEAKRMLNEALQESVSMAMQAVGPFLVEHSITDDRPEGDLCGFPT